MPQIMKMLAKAPVHFYRAAISPLTRPSCRFHPTCSDYCLQAIDRHGAVKGGILTLLRVCKCHPWHKSGFTDPVPEGFTWGSVFGYKRGNETKK